MSLPVRLAATSHTGLVHFPNEDAWAQLPTEDGGLLLAVCDGMGGMGRGDQASHMAVQELTQRLGTGSGFPPDRMHAALQATDLALRQTLCTGTRDQPGSTAVLVYLLEGLAHVCWVGDSRAYHLRDGAVLERTRDHKLVEELRALGELTEEEARTSNFSNIITRALGGRPPSEPPVEPENLDHPWRLEPGDRLLLCSDGLCDLVTDEELPFFMEGFDPETAAEALVQAALSRGGHDNITVVLCEWTDQASTQPLEALTSELEPPQVDPTVEMAIVPEEGRERRLVLLVAGIAILLILTGLLAASQLMDGVLRHRPEPPSTEQGT